MLFVSFLLILLEFSYLLFFENFSPFFTITLSKFLSFDLLLSLFLMIFSDILNCTEKYIIFRSNCIFEVLKLKERFLWNEIMNSFHKILLIFVLIFCLKLIMGLYKKNEYFDEQLFGFFYTIL